MLKLTVAVLALVLAGTASAGWRSLRVDGSSEAGFAESLAAFKEKLGPVRAVVFEAALQDIWAQGAKIADAAQREYTPNEYFRQVDGLGYNEVVTYTDPTGDTAQTRYKAAKQAAYANRVAALTDPRNNPRQAARNASNTLGWQPEPSNCFTCEQTRGSPMR